MLSDTLQAELQRYAIGPKLRELRRAKKMGLVELGEHSGLSPAMLSKIERGQLFPTLPTLTRIALVFGVGLEHFFAQGVDRHVVSITRRGQRVRLPNEPGLAQPSYIFESLDFPAVDRKIDCYLAEFPEHAQRTKPHRHDGAELLFVVEGELRLEVEGQTFTLHEGDSAYFASDLPHSYGGQAKSAKVVVVTVAEASRRPRPATRA